MSNQIEKLALAMGFTTSSKSIIETVTSFYDSLQTDSSGVEERLSLPCKKGCDACCYESVFLSAPEFLTVCHYLIEAKDLEFRTKVVREMRVIADKFEDEIEFLESAPEGFERDEVAERIKFRCPLLSSDSSCSIYPVRELNGRTFGLSWDTKYQQAYGCSLTRESLRIIDEPHTKLLDARAVRSSFNQLVENHDFVHVYPWWFVKYSSFLV